MQDSGTARWPRMRLRDVAQAVTRATLLLTNCNASDVRRRVQSKAFTARQSMQDWAGQQTLTRWENEVKRLTLTLIAGALLAAALSGCVVVPAGGYYGGGYHHGYYYR